MLPALIEALESTDQDEGIAAFLEKRKPHWKGRQGAFGGRPRS
jgi:crotonobetainyl-CoA hydratase